MNGDTDNMGGDGLRQSPKEFDFSSDFNIKEVDGTEEPARPPASAKPGSASGAGPLPKSISEAVDLSLSQLAKPPVAPGSPFVPPKREGPLNLLQKQPAAPVNDPFREPIPDLNSAWPFATPETIAKHAAPRKDAPIPANLPTGEMAAPISAPSAGPAPTPVPAAPIRPAVPIPPTPPAPPRPPLVTEHPLTPPVPPRPETSGLKNIRTYAGDVAAALATRPISKTSIAVAESKKRGEGETLSNVPPLEGKRLTVAPRIGPAAIELPSHTGRTIFIAVLSLVLIAAGAFGGYYLYTTSALGLSLKPLPVPPQKPPSLTAIVPFDSQSAISVDNANSADVLGRIRAELRKLQAPNTVKEIVFTETKDSVTYRVPAPEMMLLASVPVPDMIARTFELPWMFGTYADATGTTTPFVIVKTNLFSNAFAGMLAWEPTMERDLQPFLGLPANQPLPKGTFKDQIVRNKDVRAFVGDNGQTIFEYSFIDSTTLVVAANNETLAEAITRLENKAYVR